MRTPNEVYRGILSNVMKKGIVTTPRGFICKELDGFQECLDMSMPEVTLKQRKCNQHFMIAEFLWILAGRNDLKFVGTFNSNMKSFSDDGITLYGAYGQGIGRQLQHCMSALYNDNSSRQAVMTFWKPNPRVSKDIPCTIGLHFMVRDGHLNCYSHMRSNDLWLGFPYDVYTFSMISKFIADNLGFGLGYLKHNADSLHLYDDKLLTVKEVLKTSPTYGKQLTNTRLSFKAEFTSMEEFQKKLNQILDMLLEKEKDNMLVEQLPRGLQHLVNHLFNYVIKKK